MKHKFVKSTFKSQGQMAKELDQIFKKYGIKERQLEFIGPDLKAYKLGGLLLEIEKCYKVAIEAEDLLSKKSLKQIYKRAVEIFNK